MVSAGESNSEKRKHSRIKRGLVIRYKIKELPEGYDLSLTKNIGQGGVLLTTSRKFEKGNCLMLTLKFPFAPDKNVDVIGEVIDSREVIKGRCYETRIRFLDLDKEISEKLGEVIDKSQGGDKKSKGEKQA